MEASSTLNAKKKEKKKSKKKNPKKNPKTLSVIQTFTCIQKHNHLWKESAKINELFCVPL